MTELNLGAAIGFQAFYVISVFCLLTLWVLQFNRLSGKQVEVPPVETGSLIIAGAACIFIGLESADPFGRWDLINGHVLRLLSMAGMTCNALWLIFNGTFQTSLLLVIVQLKLKKEDEEDTKLRAQSSASQGERRNRKEGQWDNYTRAKYLLCLGWGVAFIVLIITSIGGGQGSFLWVYVVLILLGVISSGGATFFGLYTAYEQKLGDRAIASNDVRKNARRKIAVSIFEVLGYHMVFIIIMLVDIGFGTPAGSEVSGDLTYTLIVYGIANRVFIAFEMWFNWYDMDERGFAQKIADRRKHYKIRSVERMIDERIALEQERKRSGMETILSDDILRNTVVTFSLDDSPETQVRTRGYTADYIQKEAVRTGKSSRKKEIKDADIPQHKHNETRDSTYLSPRGT